MERPNERRVRLPDLGSAERRASVRFSLDLEIRYSVASLNGVEVSGGGRTIDLSSSGLRFFADKSLLPGQNLDISIAWPVQLDGDVHLQLTAKGWVVWCRGNEIALRIGRPEWKTRRGPSETMVV